MSAPSLEAPPIMPTMVSRLPKFGLRTKPSAGAPSGPAAASAGTRLTNGFYHHPGPAGVAAPPASVKQNGFLRVPVSFSMKWRKENEAAAADGEPELKTGQNPTRKPAAPSTGKGRGFGFPASSSSSPSPQSSPRTLPVSKSGSKSSQPPSGPTSGTKPALNGSRPWTNGPSGSLRQPQSFARAGSRPGSGPGSRSGSPLQKKTQASRCHSSDSLGSAPPAGLADADRFRSRSLTQVRQQPSPTLTPSSLSPHPPETSSSSSSRTAGRGLTQAPPQGGVKAPGRSGVRIPSLLPPSALKKPLLPSLGPASKHSGLSYKLSRPSLNKQSRPLRVTPAESEQEVTARTDSENSPGSPEGEAVSQGEASILGETLEDMSLSSTSSLDRNDSSQEFMDDFDNLGNGGVAVLLLSSKDEEDDSGLDQSCARFDEPAVNGVTKGAGLCFLDDGVDWTAMRLGGERGEHRLTPHRRRSSQPDYHEQGGSSLDLSPSDSCGSGGTYMWDEEGLEPLGGAATTASINSSTTHHIGSFDSDLNSIDILNNLDCDLDDDDLMLDEDLAEDGGSLHSDLSADGDGTPHMAQWRMRQLCWGTQDVHNDNDGDFQCYKLTEDPGNKRTDASGGGDLILDLCPPRSPGLGADVEELAEDCSAVRSQLEHLQRFLLQEEDADEDTLTTDTLSPETSSSDAQVQSLLQEVQQLREELRSRDQTIAQLSLQLTVSAATGRCRCQEATGRTERHTHTHTHTQTSRTERESVASQTPWRENASQILPSTSRDDQEPLTDRQPDRPVSFAQRRGTRSLRPPQPSKLHLFLSQTSAAVTPTRAAQQTPPDAESSSGLRVKPPAVTSGSSRLPKPKSH